MPRSLSAQIKAAMFAEQTSEGLIPLVTIEDQTPVPIFTTLRICDNTVDITSRGNVFTATNLQPRLAKMGTSDVPTFEVAIDNSNRAIMQEIRKISVSPKLTLEFVLLSNLEQVEFSVSGKWRVTKYDADTIIAQVDVIPSIQFRTYPGHRYTPEQGFRTVRG